MDTQAFVSVLSSEQVRDVLDTLVRKFQRESADQAVGVGGLLESNLRIMGLDWEAEQVHQIVQKVLAYQPTGYVQK